MSRTVKGSKGSGYEYWSRRPGNKFGGCIGAFAKTHTHRVERRIGKRYVFSECDGHIGVGEG